MRKRNTFTFKEKLKLKKDIEKLFLTGKAFSIENIRVVYTFQEKKDPEDAPVQVGFSVSKKKFKKAVDRNKVKRLLREAWRLSKYDFLQMVPTNIQIQLFIVYQTNKVHTVNQYMLNIQAAIEKLQKILTQKQIAN